MTALVLGFDYGRRRIGVAVGQTLTGSAAAETVVAASGDAPDWASLLAIVSRWAPAHLIVGRPSNMDGTASAMTEAAEAFAAELGERTGLPVSLVDERLTSIEARETLRAQRRDGTRRRRIRREDVDAHAAKLIVESWLADQPLAEREEQE